MLNKKIASIKIEADKTILQTMKQMDERNVRLFYAFEGEQFVGLISIGDIQRAIIRNIPLDTPIACILDKEKVYAQLGQPINLIKKKMQSIKKCKTVLQRSECHQNL